MNEFKPANIHPPETRDIAGNRIRRAIDIIREPGSSLGDRTNASKHIKKSVFDLTTSHTWGKPEFIRWPRLTAMLDHLGLPAEDVVEHWEESKGDARWTHSYKAEVEGVGASTLHWIFDANVNTILQLETARPGSTEVLAQEFGIHNFMRVRTGNFNEQPTQLINQYDNRNDTERPYGVVLLPYPDHNGAFTEPDYKIIQVREELGDTTLIRAYEFDGYEGPTGLKKKLTEAHAKYNPEDIDDKSALFGLVRGHSSGFQIQFDKYGLNSLDIDNPVFDAAAAGEKTEWDVFSKDATIVFGSCSAGVPGGIANHVAHKLGVKTNGPDDVTSINRILVKKETPLQFTAEYSKAEAIEYSPHAPIEEIREKDRGKYVDSMYSYRAFGGD